MIPCFVLFRIDLLWWKSYSGGRGEKTDKLNWERNDNATAYINELLQMKPEVVPTDPVDTADRPLEVYRLQNSLVKDERVSGTSLVVPSSTRGMWNAMVADMVIRTSKAIIAGGYWRVCGNPGLGKSRSISYFIRSLIRARTASDQLRPVIVFEHRKDGKVYLFAPCDPNDPASEYEAFSVSLKVFSPVSTAALYSPENVYIVDTGCAGGCSYPGNVDSATVLVSSPDIRHYSEYDKIMDSATFFLPVWRRMDILAARPFMMEPHNLIDEEELETRLEIVGAVPRAVFASQYKFKGFRAKIDKFSAANRSDLSIEMLLDTCVGDLVDKEHRDNDKPTSSFFGLELANDGVYTKAVVRPLSPYALLALGRGVVAGVENKIRHRSSGLGTVTGHILETLVFSLLQAGWKGRAVPLEDRAEKTATVRFSVKKDARAVDFEVVAGGSMAPLDSTRTINYASISAMPEYSVDTAEMKFEVKGIPEPALFIGGTFPVIDAADGKNRGFQVTVVDKKEYTAALLKELRRKAVVDDRYHLIHVVPAGREESFEVTVANPKMKGATEGAGEVAGETGEVACADSGTLTDFYVVALPGSKDKVWNAVFPDKTTVVET